MKENFPNYTAKVKDLLEYWDMVKSWCPYKHQSNRLNAIIRSWLAEHDAARPLLEAAINFHEINPLITKSDLLDQRWNMRAILEAALAYIAKAKGEE